MSRPWHLTRQAEASLVDTVRWMLETFGPRQAAACEGDLIGRCIDIGGGPAVSQRCRPLVDSALPEDLCFARSRQRFIVFLKGSDSVIIVDFLHTRSDLPKKLTTLTDLETRCGH